jgi:translation initiation factor IF-2
LKQKLIKVIAGEAYGRVRAMMDAYGANLDHVGPSVPVEILGLDEAPEAGVAFAVLETDKQAREIVEYRKRRSRDLRSATVRKSSLEDLFEQAGAGGIKELPVLVKADVQGSVEAIVASLHKLANDEVKIRVLHSGVGAVTGSDVALASASHAIILGFHVRADAPAKELATKDSVDLRYYSIIYDLVDDMKAILGGMLKPIIREQYLGASEIREVFGQGKKTGRVAGCFVTDGVIRRGSGVRLLRDNVVIYEGKLKTLRRFKDDVREVGANFECGMAFENFDDIKAGDVIEAFEMIEEIRTLA